MKNTLRSLFTLAVVLLVAVASVGCSSQAKKAYHLSRANRYYDHGQFKQAEIEYINVLRYDSANGQAYARLGLIYYDQGRLQRGMFFLSKASQLLPDNTDVRLKLGFIYSSAGMSTQALAQANYILEKKPQDPEAPLLLSESAVRPGEIQNVRQRLQTMAHNGDRPNIEVALGNLALREHDLAAATAAFQKAQSLDPKSAAVESALGTLAWANGDLKQADSLFKAAADASPARSPRRMQYVRFKIQSGDMAGARVLLSDIVTNATDYVPASMVLAEIAAGDKKYDESADWVDKVLTLDPDNFDAMLFQGQVDMARAQNDRAVTDMERMARVYPQVARVHYQLALAEMAANDTTKAANALSRALDLDPNMIEATVLLAQLQIRNNNPAPAIIALERVRQKQPQLIQAQLLLADAYRQQGRGNDALAIYGSLETAFPKNEQVPLLHGAALIQMKDKAGARKEFDRVLELNPDNVPAIEQLVDLDLADGQFANARERVDREIQKFPKRPEFQILSAKTFLAQNNRAEAEARLQKALEINPDSESANLLLAQIYSDAGQNDKAVAKLNSVMAKQSQNASALMLAAKIYSANKDYKGAADAYEKVLQLDPKYSPAMNNLAYLYSEYLNKLDRAYDLAQHARELLPFDPAAADTLGWVCFLKGSYPAALGFLQESAAKLPAEPEVQFHFGMASYMMGNEDPARAALQVAGQSGASFPGRDDCQRSLAILNINPDTADAAARALLEKRVSEKPDDPVAQVRLARIYLREGNNAKAALAYQAIVDALPKNLDAMIALMRIYSATDPKKAYEVAKAASKLAPYDPEVSHTLGRLAFLAGDYNLATSVLQQAAQNQANDPGLQFDYACAAYSVGRVSDAQTTLQKALTLNLPAPQASTARRMLDLINLAAAPAKAAADTSAAAILKSEPNDVPALMARAAAAEFKSDAAGAEQACEKVLERYPDFTPAQKQLSRLYAADTSQLDRAYALASKAHEANPDDADLTKTMGIILLQRADYTHAVALLNQCASQKGTDPEVFYYLGTAQYRLKNRSESKANLQQALALNLSGKLADSAKQMLNEQK